MKGFRKIRVILLCLLLAAGLAGCGEKEENYTLVGEQVTPFDNETLPEAGQEDLEQMNGVTAEVSPEATSTPANTTGESYVVCLDAGHGGDYSGAVYDGRVEKDMNLKLANLIKAYFEANYPQVTVLMTRTGDEGMSTDLVEDLQKRVEYAAENQADVYLSIHFNASEDHSSYGSMMCVSKQDNINEKSEALANSILGQLEGLGFRNNGPYTRSSNDTFDDNGVAVDYYAINRHGANNGVVAIICENCYLDNETDIALFDTDEKLAAIAKADAEGTMAYLMQQP